MFVAPSYVCCFIKPHEDYSCLVISPIIIIHSQRNHRVGTSRRPLELQMVLPWCSMLRIVFRRVWYPNFFVKEKYHHFTDISYPPLSYICCGCLHFFRISRIWLKGKVAQKASGNFGQTNRPKTRSLEIVPSTNPLMDLVTWPLGNHCFPNIFPRIWWPLEGESPMFRPKSHHFLVVYAECSSPFLSHFRNPFQVVCGLSSTTPISYDSYVQSSFSIIFSVFSPSFSLLQAEGPEIAEDRSGFGGDLRFLVTIGDISCLW